MQWIILANAWHKRFLYYRTLWHFFFCDTFMTQFVNIIFPYWIRDNSLIQLKWTSNIGNGLFDLPVSSTSIRWKMGFHLMAYSRFEVWNWFRFFGSIKSTSRHTQKKTISHLLCRFSFRFSASEIAAFNWNQV